MKKRKRRRVTWNERKQESVDEGKKNETGTREEVGKRLREKTENS